MKTYRVQFADDELRSWSRLAVKDGGVLVHQFGEVQNVTFGKELSVDVGISGDSDW